MISFREPHATNSRSNRRLGLTLTTKKDTSVTYKSATNLLVDELAINRARFGVNCGVRQPISGLGYGRGYIVAIASLTAV